MTSKEKYKLLVKCRLKNPYNGKGKHKHHAIPRCLKPKVNIVLSLSLEEHTIAHYWLMKMSHKPKTKKYMYAAFNGLRNQWFKGNKNRLTKEKQWKKFETNYLQNLIDEYSKNFKTPL